MRKLLAGLALGIPASFATAQNIPKPNVLMIAVDDLRDWVGALHGHPDTLTPNMDRLAAKGMVFRDAHASSPLCGPSRAALLSGVRATTSGLHDNLGEFDKNPVLMNCENLPQFFKRAGYKTMTSGKVFHGTYPQFWDISIPFGTRMYQAGQPKKNGTDLPGIFDWGVLDIQDSEMDDYKMAQFAVDQLSQPHDSSFFLACGIYLPHVPWYAPRAYFDKFPLESITMPLVKPDDTADLPREAVRVTNPAYTKVVDALGPEAHKKAVQAYLACINFADAQVGRVLDALERSPYKDSTIVVLFGDNGSHLGEKSKWHKDSLWKESTRVPLIIYVPGMDHKSHVCDRMASLLDIYPTLADLINVPAPAHLEGRSLKPLLENPERDWKHAVITNRRPGQAAVRTEEWCYIRYQDGSEELYNRKTDPYEHTNLAANPEYETIKKQLAGELPQDRHCVRI